MTSPMPFFDGHNDALLRLFMRGGQDAPQSFLDGEGKGQLDLPMARAGGFAGGMFAIFVPSPDRAGKPAADLGTQTSADAMPLPDVELSEAQRVTFSMASLLLQIERESQGQVKVCRDAADIQHCLDNG